MLKAGTRSWRLAPLTLVLFFLSGANVSQANEIEIGGTGAALGAMHQMLEAFTEAHPQASGTVLPSLGSGGGIKALIDGKIDLALSSRPLKDKERAAGVSAIPYGTTAIVFAVPHDNPVTGISTADLLEIYRGERPAWPSGTRMRLVLRPKSETDTKLLEAYVPELEALWKRMRGKPGIALAYTDQQSADEIQINAGGLGTTTLAMIHGEERPLKPLSLDGIAANETTIADGSYPLTKTFYIVVGPQPRPLVRDFIDFVGSAEGQALLRRTGHLPVPG